MTDVTFNTALADGTALPSATLSPEEFQSHLAEIVPAAFGYALRLTKNRADAEDLVQEAALHACRGQAGFSAGTNFKAWFYRILTTCFWGKHRRDRRRPSTVDFDDTPVLYLYQRSAEVGLPVAGEDPAAALFDRLGTERVTEALQQLPEEFGIVCTLYFMEDFAYQEIAEVLGVPVGTVRSRLHRGRKMLQKSLWQVAADAGIVGTSRSTKEAMVE
ncbi:MAG: sigma-70 family RNA polymerase sigma factor [Gemmatimonadaceae bacterium]